MTQTTSDDTTKYKDLDEFGKHELLDRTYMMMENHNTFLLEHQNFDDLPFDIKNELDSIQEAYYKVYQLISQWCNGQ